MMDNKEKILKILKNFKPELKNRFKVKNLGLFGSYVNEKQTETSDIDILVEFDVDADLFHYVGVCLFLEEKLNKKVDVVSLSALREELKGIILNEVSYA